MFFMNNHNLIWVWTNWIPARIDDHSALVAARELPEMHASWRRRGWATMVVRSDCRPRQGASRGWATTCLSCQESGYLAKCAALRGVVGSMNHPSVAMHHVPEAAYGAARGSQSRTRVCGSHRFGWVVDLRALDLLASK